MRLSRRLGSAVLAAVALVSTTPCLSTAGAATPAVTLRSCSEQNGIFPFPALLLQHDVPPGFALDTSELGPLLGAVLLDGFSCTAGGRPVTAMFAFLAVVPPAKYQTPGATGYLLLLDGWVSDPALAATFAGWGLGPVVHQAAVAFASRPLPTGPLGTVSEGDARIGVSLASLGFGPVTSFPAGGSRGFVVQPGGSVVGLDVSWTAQTAQMAFAFAVQHGGGPMPLPAGVATAGLAWNYDLTLQPVALS